MEVVVILIYGSATHNFISKKLAEKWAFKMFAMKFMVISENREKVKCGGRCHDKYLRVRNMWEFPSYEIGKYEHYFKGAMVENFKGCSC